jgi:hypothetical protein
MLSEVEIGGRAWFDVKMTALLERLGCVDWDG